MQSLHRIRRPASPLRRAPALLLCFLVLFLAGCGGGTNSNADAGGAVVQPAATKADATGIATEEKLRAQLNKVQQLMANMTLDQKLGQLLMVEYVGASYQYTDLPYMVGQQFVGGYLYQPINGNFKAPQDTVDAVKAFSVQANGDAKIPLLIAIDQEGGVVTKASLFYGTKPSAKALAQTGDPNGVKTQAAQDAQELTSLGINVDLAPVVDVQTVPDADGPLLGATNTGNRMFGTDPQTVSTYAGAFVDGLQSNNVMACLKHFPGLGSLHDNEDPHDGLPVVSRNMTDLNNIDLAPYRSMIQHNHPAMIMSTDVITQAIDPNLPAELSSKAVDGVLRQQLGYNGVVITDGLYMNGITNRWTIAQAAVMAIAAGNDIVEGPFARAQVASVVDAFKQALQSGQLTQARIDQSVQRILLVKVQYGLIA